MSTSEGLTGNTNIGRGRAPKISIDLSNSVNHTNTNIPNSSNNHRTIDSNMLAPEVSNSSLSHRDSNNNAIYSRRSLSRVTSRNTATGTRSKSRRRNVASDTENSDCGSMQNTSRSISRSRSRSVQESNLKADLKYSILNKNPYTQRIRIVDGDNGDLFDSDEESYTDENDKDDEDDDDDEEEQEGDNISNFSDNESISSVETNAPSLLKVEQQKKNKKMSTKNGISKNSFYSSDEEKIMDVDENMFRNKLKYDFTSLVMPNTDIPFADVIENCKQWIDLYKKDNNNQLEQSLLDSIDHKTFCNDTCEKLTLVLGNNSLKNSSEKTTTPHPTFHPNIQTSELPKTYIIQSDSSLESITYTITTLLKPGDQLYILHTLEQAPFLKLTQIFISITQKVLASFDQLNTNLNLDDVMVNITVLRHHYPKHFLNGMIYAVRPILIVVNNSILKGWLNGFVCGVPLLVYKREQKKRV
ncbi:hypothetical protein ACO0SA_004689 [Hanseniaspora valbyensis]